MKPKRKQFQQTLAVWRKFEIPDYFENFHAGVYSRERAIEIARASEIKGVEKIDRLWQTLEQAAFDYRRQKEIQEKSESNKSIISRLSKIRRGEEYFPDIDLEIFPDPDPVCRLVRFVVREIEFEAHNSNSTLPKFGFFPIEIRADGTKITTIPKISELSAKIDFRTEVCARALKLLKANQFAKPIDIALWSWTLRITDFWCNFLGKEFGINNDYKMWQRPMEKFIQDCAADLDPDRLAAVHNILSRAEFRSRFKGPAA